jgi:hypothetical protein
VRLRPLSCHVLAEGRLKKACFLSAHKYASRASRFRPKVPEDRALKPKPVSLEADGLVKRYGGRAVVDGVAARRGRFRDRLDGGCRHRSRGHVRTVVGRS